MAPIAQRGLTPFHPLLGDSFLGGTLILRRPQVRYFFSNEDFDRHPEPE